ncbi:porin [Polynucleobacter paneuropaeus]|nr:porin [Polynucleobacter paneuropaeus]MBT8532588.1 porin [Polynucleobacter paneuropaeus]MBT8602802.1 porin [Polynucleobacter paneuropaeus]MBT8624581.1 porin [Polynucleobacter paneuropaeus]MBT8630309.1 porin [Polynucleobacter paneuropaeus]
MKKSLFALAAVGALTGVAHAQSSVTVYGIIDEGYQSDFTKISNGGTANTPNGTVKTNQNGIGQGAQSTSRLGFKGSEDLGGGSSAFFTYEVKVTPETSTGLLSDTRQAFVGLKKNGVGAVSLGTQNTPVYDAVLTSDPGNVNNIAGNLVTPINGVGGGQTSVFKTNNAVGTFNNSAYATRLPGTLVLKSDNWNGFTARAMALVTTQNSTQTTTGNGGAVTGVGGSTNATGYGLGLDYTWQKLLLTANVQNFKANANSEVAGTYTLFSAAGTAAVGSNIQDTNQYYAATYDFGILKAYLQYINRKTAQDSNTTVFQKYTAEQIGVRSFITPTIEAWASGGVGKFNAMPTVSGTTYQATYTPSTANLAAWQIGSNYWLSKRTNLYAIYGQTSTGNYTQTLGANMISANSSNYAVGVKHTF